MNKLKSYFLFSREHRSGIFLLFVIIVFAQLGYYFLADYFVSTKNNTEDKAWLMVQSEIDSLKNIQFTKKDTIYPFNPNYITDYKGYKLGMTIQEIDRLHAYRKKGKFVNSAIEFQQITKVSNSFLSKISPYFKFPDWVKNKGTATSEKFHKFLPKEKVKIIQKDINAASREELIAVYGIGEKLADKILLEKEKFGGFVSMDQFQFIWGISPEAIADLEKRFFVKSPEGIKKIAINDLSMKELAKFPYFNYALAKEIVVYRTMNSGIKEIADLTKIKGMPNEKIKIIALYLEF
ncbi:MULTISPECIES: helix-hairpin-helix domain-containing protein [unclassified Flavobacterium]|uniref:ComEA family DNA-binding protein n=1 Tax=unclassified Flavobacterium TaxID=196869 RepID=UPI001291BCD7|nr:MULTISPECIES: helix-hairpin-helix domain-containing protein [unclassified Flavobacterium]MQP53047.1 helix-hairpin-helix domain-containing protein [Flavobacterium sp. LMO9]MQP62868.1 helix-hairpin-helix domain-containing protein [Flavobacterium sp. LMO6]